MIRRIAIVIHSDLTNGEAANVAALLCGQISRMSPMFFDELPVIDQGGNNHAAPKFSVVVLKAKTTSQLIKLAGNKTNAVCFSRAGQKFNNAFQEYKQFIVNSPSGESELIAVAIFGNDDEVRSKTKKFSLLA